ncbi:sugar phosphate isomerase/epimerase [Pedobacter frigiditerrae]|uniref:Sugar phosphate isomerase/epimerase n=1 Tax=Pedobacter frigiditerrae TaxID=2530452 RepID=A0A4R0MPF8_9SPHI|nr:sugar phosphate isomerase/epimerase family protein [Pedobacter frigiditerrae]TCC88690.1 sugar phosphate isomerase/epimerase [Pedobacter frigiditerrae]
MKNINRKEFIKYSSIALASLSFTDKTSLFTGNIPKLSFSTLGCPKWDLPQIINFASVHGYQGIEIRVIAGELDLPKSPWFNASRMADTKRMISDKKLIITDLGSSAQLHHTNKTELDKNINEAKRFIDLASQLECTYVRVFPEKLLNGDLRKKSLDTIIQNLKLLGDFAKKSNVKVLLESHGDLVEMDELQYVMQQTENNNVGMIWDIHNMWAITKQPPTAVFKKLSPYIKHVHVKDAKMIDGKEQYVLTGKGDVPLKEALNLLYQSNYEGFYSLEWEKMWHPEIEEPEIALAQYPSAVKKYF